MRVRSACSVRCATLCTIRSFCISSSRCSASSHNVWIRRISASTRWLAVQPVLRECPLGRTLLQPRCERVREDLALVRGHTRRPRLVPTAALWPRGGLGESFLGTPRHGHGGERQARRADQAVRCRIGRARACTQLRGTRLTDLLRRRVRHAARAAEPVGLAAELPKSTVSKNRFIAVICTLPRRFKAVMRLTRPRADFAV